MFRYDIGQDTELRLLEERHAAELYKLTDESREHLRPWTPWVDGTTSVDDSRAFIKHSMEQFSRGENFVTGIWYKGELAGVISFDNISRHNHSAMIGYWIGAAYKGKGLMTRSCKALIDYGFNELDLNRIVIWVATNNKPSIAIPERLGFTKEGIERQGQWLYDHYEDLFRYSLLKEEYMGKCRN